MENNDFLRYEETKMESNDYQKQALDDGEISKRVRQSMNNFYLFNCEELLYAGLGLASESGEVSNIINKWIGQGAGFNKKDLVEELGDVLWYVAKLCDCVGVNISHVMQANLDKLHKRYPYGFNVEQANKRNQS